MGNFFAELKRRHIYRVAAAYAVVAWVLLQLVNNIAPVLDLPVWVARAFLLALVIGFPIAMLIVWMRELAPADGATRAATGKLDWVLIGALVAVLGLVSYQQLAPMSGTGPAQQADIANSSASTNGISVAVLPFVNLSDDRQQEFFSDGMTEEITSALAKVKGLNVVARTSAFEFKGQNKDVRTIAQALSASHLIEGSVRKAGARVRITAQLIRADTGAHLWTDSYDRELKDIFATQEDIAQAIAGALQVPLGLKQGETLVPNRTIDTESYQNYLHARALSNARRSTDDAISLLQQVVARNPDYAPAWATLSDTYSTALIYTPAVTSGSPEAQRIAAEFTAKQIAAAQRAIALDPNQADVVASLGQLEVRRNNLVLAEELYSKALTLDPNNAYAMQLKANLLAGVGRPKEGLAAMKAALAIEPFVPAYNSSAARHFWLNGQAAAAISILMDLPSDFVNRAPYLAQIYAAEGRYGDAATTLAEIPPGTFLPGTVEDAIRLLRMAPKPSGSPQTLPRLGHLGFVYLYVGAPERILEYFEDAAKGGYSAVIGSAVLWHPSATAVRKTERFKNYIRSSGVLEYWRARGWPDLCRPVGADDFVCD